MMTAVKNMPEPRPGDILAALTELGVTDGAKGAADELFILCPYHDDRTIGSFSINLRTGLNSCFSCRQGGSFHKFLMAASPIPMNRQQARRWCLQRLIATTDTREETATPDSPVINEASMALFTEPPNWACENKKITVAACKAREILWNPVNGSWIFPIRDPYDRGKLLGWQEKHQRHHAVINYPPGVRVKSALFGWETCEQNRGRVTLVESPLDAAVMWEAGFPCALSSYGSMVSDTQLDLLEEKYAGLILAMDDDHAGWEATDRIMRRPMSIPRHVFQYLETWKGKDPGELDGDQIRWGMRHLLC